MADSRRIQDNLKALSTIGATLEGGATRLAWTEQEREAHRLAIRWMEDAGFEAMTDALGNTYGCRKGIRVEAAHTNLYSQLQLPC